MTQYKIEGMTCNGCRTRVENKLKELDVNASVNLESGEAILDASVDKEAVIATVSSLGYTVVQ